MMFYACTLNFSLSISFSVTLILVSLPSAQLCDFVDFCMCIALHISCYCSNWYTKRTHLSFGHPLPVRSFVYCSKLQNNTQKSFSDTSKKKSNKLSEVYIISQHKKAFCDIFFRFSYNISNLYCVRLQLDAVVVPIGLRIKPNGYLLSILSICLPFHSLYRHKSQTSYIVVYSIVSLYLHGSLLLLLLLIMSFSHINDIHSVLKIDHIQAYNAIEKCNNCMDTKRNRFGFLDVYGFQGGATVAL